MTLDQFIAKYTGKFVEYHSYSANAKFQCVDLANQYIVECLGLTAIIGTNAQDFPKKADSNWQYTANTPTGYPNKGDLIIFSSADGVGHISVCITATANSITSFDQNYPTGTPCHQQNHTYKNVMGWLSLKGNDMALQDVLNHYKVKTEQELIAMVDQQLAFLESERQQNKDLVTKINRISADLLDTEVALAQCQAVQPADPTWVENGKIVETTNGNTKTIINYAKKA